MLNLKSIEIKNCKGNIDTAIASIMSHKNIDVLSTPIDTLTSSHDDTSSVSIATTTTAETHSNKLIEKFIKEEKELSTIDKIDHTVATVMNTLFNDDLFHNKSAQELLSYITSHCEIPTDTKGLIIESLSALHLNADFNTELLCNLTGDLHINDHH